MIGTYLYDVLQEAAKDYATIYHNDYCEVSSCGCPTITVFANVDIINY